MNACNAHPLDAYKAIVGTVPDIEVARSARVSGSTVTRYRQSLGVPAYGLTRAVVPGGAGWAHLLGTMTDTALAELAGVSAATAARWRRDRNIEPHRLWSKLDRTPRKPQSRREWSRLSVWAREYDLAFGLDEAISGLKPWRASRGSVTRMCQAATRRGELVCLTEPAPGVPGEWVTP